MIVVIAQYSQTLCN